MKLKGNMTYVFSGRRAGRDHRQRLLLELTVNRRNTELMLRLAGRHNRDVRESTWS
jgi:hypothetical protein